MDFWRAGKGDVAGVRIRQRPLRSVLVMILEVVVLVRSSLEVVEGRLCPGDEKWWSGRVYQPVTIRPGQCWAGGVGSALEQGSHVW